MGENFRKEDFPLVPVRIELFHGFIFANLDEHAPPLATHFKELPDLSRFRMGELVCGKRIEYDVAANWKLICENYSECYHCAGAHPQLHRISEPMPRNSRKSEIGNCFNGGPMMLREGIDTMSMSGKSGLPTIPGLSHEDCRLVHYYVVYPNMLLSPHPDYVLVHTAWPVSPERTHIVCEWLVTKEALSDQGRCVRRRRVLGHDESAGLVAVRARAGWRHVARLPAGALSADGRLRAHVRQLVRQPPRAAP